MSDQNHGFPRRRIAVLLGGDSTERKISLKSGAAVAAALESRGHRVCRIDPSETDLSSVDWPKFDAAFIALHGRFGEDGQIQSQFESWGVPYTGSDATASRIAFSKSAAKERFETCGVPTPPYRLIHDADALSEIARLAEEIGYPLMMKPDASGSSLGVSLVSDSSQLAEAARACFDEGRFGLLEQAVVGTEWTLGLIDDERLPLLQIDAARPFFDYAAKYDDDQTEYCFENDLPAEALKRIETVAAAAAAAIDTRGVARVDVRLDEAHQPWVLEVNTVPGFTEHSLVPKAAERAGASLADLCERAVESCLRAGGGRRQDRDNRSVRRAMAPLRHAG